jgi:multidrug efflux system outer membrane protein
MNPTTFAAAALALAASASGGSPMLSLDDALREAVAKNPDLAQARERLRQSRELSKKVLANYLPQVSVSGSFTRNQYPASISMPTGFWLRDMSGIPGFDPTSVNGPNYDPQKGFPSSAPDTNNPPGAASNTVLFTTGVETLDLQKKYQLGVRAQLVQPLIVPALWPAFRIANLGEQQVAATVESARREVLFAVVQLYYGCAGLRQTVEIQQRLLENDFAHEKQAKVQVDSTAAPAISLIRAQIDRTKAEQDLVRARASYASAKLALGTLMGRLSDFDVEPPPEPEVETNLEALEAQALSARPDLQAGRLAREVAARSRSAVWYSYAPSLAATATYQAANVKGFTNSYDSWALGIGLSWTVWDGGLREIQLRENASKLAEADEAQRGAELKALEEVRRAMLDLTSARANRAKAEETVRLARENMRLVNVAYQAGAATPVEVSDASTALAAAELTLVGETLNSQLAALKLAKAAGGFDPRPSSAFDPAREARPHSTSPHGATQSGGAGRGAPLAPIGFGLPADRQVE